MLRSLPTDLGQFMEVINDLARRMSPLSQIAEQAGGLFGLRIPGFGGATPAPKAAPAAVTPARRRAGRRARSRPRPRRTAPARKAPARKARGEEGGAAEGGRPPEGSGEEGGRQPSLTADGRAGSALGHERRVDDRAAERGAADIDGDRRSRADRRRDERERDAVAEHR